jgi:hypothetical protein
LFAVATIKTFRGALISSEVIPLIIGILPALVLATLAGAKFYKE